MGKSVIPPGKMDHLDMSIPDRTILPLELYGVSGHLPKAARITFYSTDAGYTYLDLVFQNPLSRQRSSAQARHTFLLRYQPH